MATVENITRQPHPVEESEPLEPCPTPLSWSGVLESFRNESEPWGVETPSGRVDGRVIGAGSSILFLNGFCGTYELYCLVAWLLRETHRCIVFDYPESTISGNSHTTIGSREITAIADHLNVDQCSLFASSYGTVAALNTIRDRPDRIDRVILQAGFAHRSLSLTERLAASICRCSRWSVNRLPIFGRVQRLNHARWFPPFDDSRLEFFLDNVGSSRACDVANRIRAATRFDARPWLNSLTTPTLILRTEGDGPVLTACADELETGLANVSTEWMHTSGHFACLTHPHRVAKIVRDFMKVEPSDPVAGRTCQ